MNANKVAGNIITGSIAVIFGIGIAKAGTKLLIKAGFQIIDEIKL